VDILVSKTRDRLEKVVGKPKKVHLTWFYPGEPTHNGFVLGLGLNLVLLHQFHDFSPEGYTALRVADIKRVRSGEHERFSEMMLRGEGIMDRVGISYEVPLEDFRSLLTFLHERRQHVIVECEDRRNAEYDDFTIGRIVNLDDVTVSVLHFDSLGTWNDVPSIIAFTDVTKIQFDTPYINTITKYLKVPPPGYGIDTTLA
jgi:hypothetical protein